MTITNRATEKEIFEERNLFGKDLQVARLIEG